MTVNVQNNHAVAVVCTIRFDVAYLVENLFDFRQILYNKRTFDWAIYVDSFPCR